MGADATAIIVAAGSGRRMGFDKLFADLGGEPVLARTLRAFQACEAVSEIIVVAAEARVGEVASLAANIGAGKVAAAIPGGAERHQSVWRGIQAASPESALLAVHDGARPLIAPEAIARCLAAAAGRGAAACARPVADTMMRADAEGRATERVDRTNLWAMETPQCFRADLLRRAYEQAIKRGEAITDEVSALLLIGEPVHLVATGCPNPKITFPGDIEAAARLLG